MAEIDEERLLAKIDKYRRILETGDEERYEYAFDRLESVPITLERLQSTGVGRTVSRFVKDESFGRRAHNLVKKWRSIAEAEQRRAQLMPNERAEQDLELDMDGDEANEESNSRSRSSRSHQNVFRNSASRSPSLPSSRERSPSPVVAKKRTSAHGESSSSAKAKRRSKPAAEDNSANNDMFAAMLATANDVKTSRTKKPRLEPKNPLVRHTEKIARSYVAATQPQPESSSSSRNTPFDDTDMFKARKETRVKVFAGRRKANLSAEVPRLETLCINVLTMHLNDIDEMNGVSYTLIKPVLEKCTPEQLLNIESYNEYLIEDTDELWAKICENKYPSEESDYSESWREFYMRKQRENEDKLKKLVSNISKKNNGKNTVSGRQALQLDSPMTPREVRKRAMFHGVQQSSAALPSAIEVSKSRREIFNSGSKASFSQLPAVIRQAKHSNVGAKTERRIIAPPPQAGKRGALMAKTLKMLKNKRR